MYTYIKANQLHEGIQVAMMALNNGDIVTGENQDREEKLKEISLILDIENVSSPTISKAMPSDLYTLVEYDLEFNEGVRDFEPAWEYTYSRLFRPYLNRCINELLRNKSTRRAVLPIAGEFSYGNSHPTCMQNIIYKIDNNKLNTTVLFRSNDGCKAITMNQLGIIRLTHYIANIIGVEVGSYTHIANSFHCYQNDWDQLNAYCEMFKNREDTYFTFDEYLEVFEEYADEYREKCLKRKAELEARKNG